MKKILLTIFVFAAIIACEKDAYDNDDVTNINVLEQAEEINASVETTSSTGLDVEALTARLTRLAGNTKGVTRKLNSSTAKTGGAGSHIKLISGVETTSNIYYEFLFSDDISLCNLPNFTYLETIWLVLNSANETEIRAIAPSGEDSFLVGTITADLSFLYEITFSEGLFVDLSDLSVDVVSGESQADITLGSVNFDLSCEGILYEVTPAPFPLRGFLATKIAGATFPNATPSNYAGTDRNDVVRAIETNITD